MCLCGEEESYQLLATYQDKDGLEEGTSPVPSQVSVTEEGTDEREEVDSPCPFTNIISCASVVLTHHPRQKQNQVHSYSEEGQCSKPLVN